MNITITYFLLDSLVNDETRGYSAGVQRGAHVEFTLEIKASYVWLMGTNTSSVQTTLVGELLVNLFVPLLHLSLNATATYIEEIPCNVR